MNSADTEVPYNGILLTDNVDMNWLERVSPRYHQDFIKFIVNTATNEVVVGMDVHADGVTRLSQQNRDFIYGGNIFFADSRVEYESTLNIDKNLRIGSFEDPRVISDPSLIERIEPVLSAWIEL